MRLIDADTVVTGMVYDDEHEECFIRHMTIAGYLDAYTDEGCPPTIEAVPVRRGKWEEHPFDEDWDICSVCGFGTKRREHGNEDGRDWVVQYVYDFCPRCGARLEEA